jgi:hypothetical protein
MDGWCNFFYYNLYESAIKKIAGKKKKPAFIIKAGFLSTKKK